MNSKKSLRLFTMLFLVTLLALRAEAQELFSVGFDTLPAGTALPVDTWQVVGGTDASFWTITENGLNTGNLDTYPAGLSFAFINTDAARNWTNTKISARMRVQQQEGSVALAVRVKNPSNYYYTVFQTRVSGGTTNRTAEMYKLVNGVPRPLASRGVSSGDELQIPAYERDNAIHTIAFEARGQTLTTFFDGKPVLTVSDQEFDKGSAGIGAAFNQVIFQSVTVTEGGDVSAGVPSGGGTAKKGDWRVLVISGLSQEVAKQAARDYELQDLKDVEVLQKDGKYAVYMGRYASREEAEAAFEQMENDFGLLLESVEQAGSGAAVAAPGATSSGKATSYRVQVGNFLNLGEAQGLAERVEQELGVYPVDVSSEGRSHRVLAGFAFDNRSEADDFTNWLKENDLADAQVVQITASASGESEIEQSLRDLEGTQQATAVSQGERAQVIELIRELERARQQGVRRGQQQELVNRMEAFNPEQRRLFEEMERQLDAEKSRRARARELDQQVQEALVAQDYDRAVSLLEEWRRLEPESQVVLRGLEEARALKTEAAEEGSGSIVVDNDDGAPAFTNEGSWAASTTPGYRNKLAEIAKPGEPNTATWTFRIGTPGLYAVEVYYQANPNRTTSTVYRVIQGTRTDTQAINQRSNDRQWVSLGDFAFEQGQAIVRLDGQASTGGEVVVADAARLRFLGEGRPVVSSGPDRITQLLQGAREAEEAGKFEDATRFYLEIKGANPPADVLTQANQALNRLEEQRRSEGEGNEEGRFPILYLIIGVVVIVVAVVGFLAMKKKSAAPKTAKAPSSGAGLSSLQGPGKSAVAKGPSAAVSAKTPPAVAKEEVEEELRPTPPTPAPTPVPSASRIADKDSKLVVADTDRIRPGVTSPKVEEESKPKPEETPESSFGSIPLDDIEGLEIFQDEESPTPQSSGAIKLDSSEFLTPATPEPPYKDSSEGVDLGEEEPQAPAPAAADSAPVPAPQVLKPQDSNIYYQQFFEDEEPGARPRNWKGEYDYASLVVTDQESREGSSRCLKFEKRQGTGSAYYACKFPDAGGRVCVEFDLRCDDKNKYLLGFYIEKDEDFRHSIHTVVHKDMARPDKVSLRMQNETVPYTLGEWVHVRFVIDLPRALVDGYVNEQPVAVGVRLTSRPKVLNTLSIRDNLATEGVLLIDNIKIYRDR